MDGLPYRHRWTLATFRRTVQNRCVVPLHVSVFDPPELRSPEICQGGGRVRVVVAEDHPVYREGVIRALEDNERIEVVAQAGEGVAALSKLRSLRPAVALLDVRMPGVGGLELLETLEAERLPIRVLLLSAYTDAEMVHGALAAGAAGYLSKDTPGEEICRAVLGASEGETVVSPALQPALVANIGREARREREERERLGTLSGREREVLALAAQGRTGRQIGEDLYLSHTTVKTHLQRTYRKLGVPDKAAAVAEALRRGLLE